MSTYDPNYKSKKVYALVGQKALIINNQSQILILQRSEKSGAGGKWSLPGGGLDYGENSEEGIIREIREETNLTITNLKPLKICTYVHKDDFIVIIGYVCQATSNAVKLNWEHDSYKWVSKEGALQLELAEDARRLIEYAQIPRGSF